MLLRASVILAEFLAWVVLLRLCQVTGGRLSGGIFAENQVPSATRFAFAMYACVGEREGSLHFDLNTFSGGPQKR
jgi:hypothetical protein